MSDPAIGQLRQEAAGLMAMGQPAAAVALFEQLIDREPGNGDHWCGLARALAAQRCHREAVACLLRGADVDPASIACRSGLGHLLHELSRPEEAIHWHGEALALQPDSLLLRLNHLYVLPLIASCGAQIDQHRQRIEAGTAALLADPQLRLIPQHEGMAHTFRLAYHGQNDRALLHAYGQLRQRGLAQLFPGESWRPRLQPERGERSRLRLGFISAFLEHNHTNTRAFEGLIRGLDRDRFEVVLLLIGGSAASLARQPLGLACEQVIALPEELPLVWQRIVALDLDLLFYTDIGMHPFLHFLAPLRLAPLQVCGWGIPHSSGHVGIDHYISSDLVEPADADAHYSESLIRLPGLPCCYLSDNLPSREVFPALGRDYFFLPDADTRLFGCLQHLQKLHPDFDAILEAIARELPQAGFVLVESSEPGLTQLFLERVSVSAPAFHGRLVLLQRMQHQEYLALVRCLDLLLDPLHYGSGITMFETMVCGTPSVCLEGAFLRSRIVAAAYRRMQIDAAPIARSAAEYVELAVALMRDDARRQALRQQIEAFATDAILRRRQGLG